MEERVNFQLLFYYIDFHQGYQKLQCDKLKDNFGKFSHLLSIFLLAGFLSFLDALDIPPDMCSYKHYF